MFPAQVQALLDTSGGGSDPRGVLRELRGHHGGPHLGTRVLALLLALLLAAPLTVFLWRVLSAVLDALW